MTLTIPDLLLLACVGAALAAAVRWLWHRRGTGCSGCAGCSGCTARHCDRAGGRAEADHPAK